MRRHLWWLFNRSGCPALFAGVYLVAWHGWWTVPGAALLGWAWAAAKDPGAL